LAVRQLEAYLWSSIPVRNSWGTLALGRDLLRRKVADISSRVNLVPTIAVNLRRSWASLVTSSSNDSKFTYNLRFPGQYFDAESGQMYNYARDYDPQTGRYIESDPMGLFGRSYSTYSYVNDNPIGNVDPGGLYLCMYSISAHNMSCTPDLPGDPSFSSISYVSGNNGAGSCQKCRNNPADTNVPFHGPIPIGSYTIGGPTRPGGLTGPFLLVQV